MTGSDLESRWRQACGDGLASRRVFADLGRRYSEPHRRYHTLEHIGFGLQQFDPLAHLARHPEEVVTAFFFHDAVYATDARDNEERSAQLAIESCGALGFPDAALHRIARLIRATAFDASPATTDEEMISDIDLAILGQERKTFDHYERLVREEYAAVPDEAFWAGRKAILGTILDRESIYFTGEFRDRYEASARANIAATIEGH